MLGKLLALLTPYAIHDAQVGAPLYLQVMEKMEEAPRASPT